MSFFQSCGKIPQLKHFSKSQLTLAIGWNESGPGDFEIFKANNFFKTWFSLAK